MAFENDSDLVTVVRDSTYGLSQVYPTFPDKSSDRCLDQRSLSTQMPLTLTSDVADSKVKAD